jgi:hypothetical protein
VLTKRGVFNDGGVAAALKRTKKAAKKFVASEANKKLGEDAWVMPDLASLDDPTTPAGKLFAMLDMSAKKLAIARKKHEMELAAAKGNPNVKVKGPGGRKPAALGGDALPQYIFDKMQHVPEGAVVSPAKKALAALEDGGESSDSEAASPAQSAKKGKAGKSPGKAGQSPGKALAAVSPVPMPKGKAGAGKAGAGKAGAGKSLAPGQVPNSTTIIYSCE